MKSQYTRDISKEYFRPLKRFNYNPDRASNRQIEFAEMLSKKYGIPEGNILRLIMYVGIAWSYATDSEIELYYSDITEIGEFEKEPFPIDKIVFRGEAKAITITNPYLIDKLYSLMLDYMDPRKVIKRRKADTRVKRPSLNIIKLIAAEICNELTGIDKITGSRLLYISGYIFGFYNIEIKKNDPILNEQQRRQTEDKKADEAYAKYVKDHKKRCKSIGVQVDYLMSRVDFDLKHKPDKPRKSYLQYLNERMKNIVNC